MNNKTTQNAKKKGEAKKDQQQTKITAGSYR